MDNILSAPPVKECLQADRQELLQCQFGSHKLYYDYSHDSVAYVSIARFHSGDGVAFLYGFVELNDDGFLFKYRQLVVPIVQIDRDQSLSYVTGLVDLRRYDLKTRVKH